MRTTGRNEAIVVSSLRARAIFGKLSQRVKLAAPEPDVLLVLGQESRRNGTDAISSRQIDIIIRAARAKEKK